MANDGLDRREFLRASAATGVALSLLPLAASAADPPRVRRHVTLGRTGLQIGDIGFGSSRLDGDEALVRHALDRGIDYFDTAEDYSGGASEETLGRALRGVREKVTIASKVAAGARDGVADLFRALEGSLRRLQTDRIDVYFNHAVNDVDRLANPAWGEFCERAKHAGQDPLHGHVGPRRPPRGMPRLRARPRSRRRRARGAQLRAGPGVLRAPHEVARLHRRAARAAASAREGEAEEGGRGGDEDAARRAPERSAALRERGQHVRAGRLPLGTDGAPRRRARRHDGLGRDGGRVSGRVGGRRREPVGSRSARALRGAQRRDAVPPGLRRLPRGVSGGRGDRRRAAHAHVRGRLRRPAPGARRVRSDRAQCAGLCRLRAPGVHGRCPYGIDIAALTAPTHQRLATRIA